MTTIIPQKHCPRCNQFKDATTEFFHRDNSHLDGLQTYCKVCRVVKSESPQKGGRPHIFNKPKRAAGRPRKANGICLGCGETDPNKFVIDSRGYKNSRCKKCDNRQSVYRSHGLSEQEYQAMFEAQFGLCAICGKAPRTGKFCIDHDHKTGKIRDLLCHTCNNLLGCVQDNPQTLKKAIKYLQLHSTK